MSVIAFICIVVLVLLITGVLASIRLRRHYRLEREAVIAFDQYCSSVAPASGTFSFAEGAAWAAVRKATSLDSPIVQQRLEIGRKMARNGLPVSAERLHGLSAGEQVLEQRALWPSFCLGILLLVGLMGTFWGFREMLGNSELSGALQTHSAPAAGGKAPPASALLSPEQLEKYQRGLSKVYEGFTMAFIPSISGIFGTIILLFFQTIVLSRGRIEFEAKLDRLTEEIIIPWFCRIDDPVEVLARNLSTPLMQVVDRLGVVATALENSTRNTQLAIQNAQIIGNKLQESAVSLGETFGADSSFAKNVKRLTKGVTRFEESREQVLAQMSRFAESGVTQAEKAGETLERVTLLGEQMLQVHAESRRDMAHTVERNQTFYDQTARSNAQGTQDALTKLTAACQATVTHLVQNLQQAHRVQMDSAASAFDSMGQAQRQALADLNKQAGTLLDVLRQQLAPLAEREQAILRSLTALETRLKSFEPAPVIAALETVRAALGEVKQSHAENHRRLLTHLLTESEKNARQAKAAEATAPRSPAPTVPAAPAAPTVRGVSSVPAVPPVPAVPSLITTPPRTTAPTIRLGHPAPSIPAVRPLSGPILPTPAPPATDSPSAQS